jgi:hypothetical protein
MNMADANTGARAERFEVRVTADSHFAWLRTRVALARTAWLGVALITMSALASCATPNPNTPAGRAEIAGQKCNVCILENPGDGAPCYAICMQKEEDQATYMKAYGR